MKNPGRAILWMFLPALVSGTALAQPGELLRQLRENIAHRLLPSLVAEQRETLRGIKDRFLADARPDLQALGAEARALVGSIREILSDDQETKIRELIRNLKDLPLSRKFGILRRLSRSLRGEELARDVGLFLDRGGDAEEKVLAADRIARRAAQAATRFLTERGAFGDQEGTAIAKAIDDFLERTRARRSDLGKIAQQKLLEAWNALTDEQRSRLELARSLALGWLSVGARG